MGNGPLSGTRVLELGRFISAPYTTMLLADFGAEVIKIESVDGGDPFRLVGADKMPSRFLAYNRNKASIGLNIRSESGLKAILDLVRSADVLVENYRPGVTTSLGLGYDRIRDINPSLVYCSITGAGTSGPLASAPMYDAIGQALSGLTAQLTTGEVPKLAGPAMSDSITGMTAAMAIQAALLERTRTGKGTHVETSLLQATTSFLAEPAAHWFRSGEVQDWLTRPRQSQSFGFTDVDGRAFVIHLSSPQKFWNRLLDVIGRQALSEDPRFATYELRVANYRDLQDVLQDSFIGQSRPEWLTALAAADVPAAPVLTTNETFAHPQVVELGLEQELEGDGGYRVVGPGVHVGAWRAPMTQPPAHGADTERLLTELGYSPDLIVQLRDEGAIL